MAFSVTANRLIIAGGGLAGCLAALAVARWRPDIDVLLVEETERLGGNHVWSFFDSDVDQTGHTLLAPLIVRRWADHEVRFPRRRRRLPIGYNSISSDRLDQVVRAALGPARLIVGKAVVSLEENGVVLADGQRLGADAVLDARGTSAFPGLRLAWQKFVGRIYRFVSPHGLERPIIMDATVEQIDGYRFVYCLPFSAREMLVEDTYYSASPALDLPVLRGRLDAYAASAGWPDAEIVGEEQGVLPIVLGGDPVQLWDGAKVPLLGLRGGFFQPTTGYSLPSAVRNALLLSSTPVLSTRAVYQLLRSEAERDWRAGAFYRLLNRMLFSAATPNQRYAVLEHFYRLDPALIGRFYSGQLGSLDKLRILTGKPPVSVARAIAAALGRKGQDQA